MDLNLEMRNPMQKLHPTDFSPIGELRTGLAISLIEVNGTERTEFWLNQGDLSRALPNGEIRTKYGAHGQDRKGKMHEGETLSYVLRFLERK